MSRQRSGSLKKDDSSDEGDDDMKLPYTAAQARAVNRFYDVFDVDLSGEIDEGELAQVLQLTGCGDLLPPKQV